MGLFPELGQHKLLSRSSLLSHRKIVNKRRAHQRPLRGQMCHSAVAALAEDLWQFNAGLRVVGLYRDGAVFAVFDRQFYRIIG